MSYTAKHYVNIGGRMYTPGEIIDVAIPESKLPRLLRLGAVAPRPVAIMPEIITGGKDAAGGDEGKREDNVPDNAPADMDTTTEDDAEETEAEEYEETEAPEIDVMDGIVSAAEEPAEEPTEEAPPKKTTSKGRKKA